MSIFIGIQVGYNGGGQISGNSKEQKFFCNNQKFLYGKQTSFLHTDLLPFGLSKKQIHLPKRSNLGQMMLK